jgi:excisionase family DNA binding protein
MRVSRVQTAERTVSATDQEAAIEKVRAELDKPYGFLGSWKTEGYEVEILSMESRVDGVPGALGEGPRLFSIKSAAEHLGVSQSSLYELIRTGELEHLRMGRRILISRESLDRFIETNTTTSFYG